MPNTQPVATTAPGNGFAVPFAAIFAAGGLILLAAVILCLVTPQAYGPAVLVAGAAAFALFVTWKVVSSVPIPLDLDH
ncbi:MAG: hypothetical protein KGI78_04235 [Patescibacteria group bacterium]|nr:hypothetical protein [Patescibacteria group bacterium]MDE2058022.1 hypothetical protein [Patescibacteria group bacterium]